MSLSYSFHRVLGPHITTPTETHAVLSSDVFTIPYNRRNESHPPRFETTTLGSRVVQAFRESNFRVLTYAVSPRHICQLVLKLNLVTGNA